MGAQGEFIIPQYSADGHLIGWHTSHYEQGQVSGQQSSVPVGEEDVPRHRAKVPRTEPSNAASAGGRPMASTSRRQSSFTETRGKRQQFDIECISSDDDDTVNVGTGAAFHVWHRPTEPARSSAPGTVPIAEAVFGVQEGGPTVTHYTAAGDESDSEMGFSPFRDPFLEGGETDVSSGHEFESLISDMGSGYLVQPETAAPSYASLLETEPISSPEVTFVAEPLQPTVPRDVHDVAVGSGVPEPWYSLPPNVSLHSVLSMVQRNVGVAVRDILQTELGDPALMDTLHHEVMETFVSFGATSYQMAIRDLHLQLQHVEGELRFAPTQKPVNGIELQPG